MKSLALPLLFVPALGLAQAMSVPVQPGAAMPMGDHAMLNVDGQRVAIDDVAGEHGTLVIFTCNHCPWARAWESRITSLANRYAARGVGVIAINSNDPNEYRQDRYEVMVQRARQAGMRFPYVVDASSDVARAFGATHTPEAFLYDASGGLFYHGAVDDNAASAAQVRDHYLRDALEALVRGDAPPFSMTHSVGCSIKFR